MKFYIREVGKNTTKPIIVSSNDVLQTKTAEHIYCTLSNLQCRDPHPPARIFSLLSYQTTFSEEYGRCYVSSVYESRRSTVSRGPVVSDSCSAATCSNWISGKNKINVLLIILAPTIWGYGIHSSYLVGYGVTIPTPITDVWSVLNITLYFELYTLHWPQSAATNVDDTLVVIKVELGHIWVESFDVCAQLTDLQGQQ